MALALAVAVSGCATLPSGEAETPAATAPVSSSRFSLEGRIQVRNGEQSAVLGLQWQHEPASDEWFFTGPLGQGLANLKADADGATLTLANGQRRNAASPGELASSLLGIDAPLERLSNWATGQPPDGAEVRRAYAAGRPLRIFDQGWQIDYLDYNGPLASDPPRKIEVQRGDALLRLIIDTWNP
ncbi:MAG: outer membrane lipoprotein LolB [Zoogloea sp.]|nr:outer membrane lipoprotein LolB [Zoogloea sp.]